MIYMGFPLGGWLSGVDAVLAAACAWIALGAAGMAAPGNLRLSARVLYPAGALVGVVLGAVALASVGNAESTRVLPLGLPGLPFHVRLDPLSAFFLLLLAAVATGVSVYTAGYFRTARAPRPACCACSTTCSSPAWASCCWPTMPTLHGGVGNHGAVLVSSSSRRNTASPRFAAPASFIS